jgi:hypothetical protein
MVGTAEPKRVAVFGAGVAGLTVAHELIRRGHEVTVYEANADAGGFFRSARGAGDMPTEYSWHGLGPWYHNVFDVMRQIPFDEHGSVYDRALSRPVNYGVAGDHVNDRFELRRVFGPWHKFRMTLRDRFWWAWVLLKTWAANRRTVEHYAAIHASDAWRSKLKPLAWKTWRSTFGPWVGSDWTRVSLHHVGQFFRKNLMSGPAHEHRSDEYGPSWVHGSGAGWILLSGPSSEVWFGPWVTELERRGVEFAFEASLRRLSYDGRRVAWAELESGDRIVADHYVLAMTPYACADVLARTPDLAALDELRLFRPLVADPPHTQVSFRIAFDEPISWPVPRCALVLADSEFDITIFAQEQAWHPEVALGHGVRSLWTGTACAGNIPGRVHGLSVEQCTREQFLEEVLTQIQSCECLDRLLRMANWGRGIRDFPVFRIEVWHEWQFSADGIVPRQPKWVTTTTTESVQPGQVTPVPNLFLAGAHTRTSADLWSIEAAVESGRHAARGVEPDVTVLEQYKAPWLRLLSAVDDCLFAVGAPHVLDLLFVGGVAVVVGALAWACS